MSAIALTDSNNLFGAMEFTKKAIKKKNTTYFRGKFNSREKG